MAREIDDAEDTAVEVQAEGNTEVQADSTDQSSAVTSTDSANVTTSGTENTEPEVDVEALREKFEAAVTAALDAEGRDASTGTLPESAFTDVRAAYADMPTRERTRARDYVQGRMTAYMTGVDAPNGEADFSKARSYLEIFNAIKAPAPKAQIVKAPVDPTEAHVKMAVAIMLAPNLLPVAEGVASDWQQQARVLSGKLSDDLKKYRDWLLENADKPADQQSAAPEVDEVILQSARIARGRSAGRKASSTTAPRTPREPGALRASSGERHDVAQHIREAFDGVNSGDFLSITEIVKFKSSEYGDDTPSPGAIAARLFPASGKPCTIEGITPGTNGTKGAYKK